MFFFFQAEDGIRDGHVTGVQTCALPISAGILYSVRWFFYAAATGPMTIIGLQVLHGLTFGIFYLAAFDYITRLIPKDLQATGHLVFFAVFFGVSGIVGSLSGGAIIDAFSGGTLYFGMGCLALIGTICLTVYHALPYGKSNTTRSVE